MGKTLLYYAGARFKNDEWKVIFSFIDCYRSVLESKVCFCARVDAFEYWFLGRKMMRRARLACLVGRDSSHSSSESTHTRLLILKSTDLEKLSKSIPTPLISFFNPTATAAKPAEWVMLPLTESGQVGSRVSVFLRIGSDSRPNLESVPCAYILPRVNSVRLFCELNDSAIACSSGRRRKSWSAGFCPQ